MFASKDVFLTPPSGYSIAKSVRLRSSASAYFNRTPASASNRKTYTFSCWAKRGSLSSNQNIVAQGNNEVLFRFNTTDNINFADYTGGSAVWEITSSSVYRDPSAWYHIVFAIDTTQATSSNRVKVWINNSQVTFTGTYPTLNSDTPFNTTNAMLIGNRTGVSQYYDGYLTEINFIDGQALTPSSFGSTNALTGVWQPAKYTGTYGTNGFYLNFSDNSNNTATTIGKDYSGNGNNWTPNNISVTAGATYDSMVDSPTVSAVSSNYCVMNPLFAAGGGTFSNGNLQIATGTSTAGRAIATMGVSSGKWYWEITPTSIPANVVSIGFVPNPTTNESGTVGNNASEYGYLSDGQKFSGGSTGAYGASYVANDVIGVALDLDAGTIVFYKNGTSQGTAYSSIPLTNTYIPAVSDSSSSNSATFVANFGQRPFTYTPPTGFVALNTNNLPVPTIKNGAGYMAATLYTGNGSTQTVNNSAGFYPDFNWIKSRNNAGSHVLVNSVVGGTKQLFSNLTDAEQTNTNITNGISSSGIALGNNSSGTGSTNQNTYTYVLWQWLAGGGTSSSNTNGSITSTVSAGATQGFSVVTYTGTGANATVGHGLGVAPSMYLVKSRSLAGENWIVYHTSLGNAQQLNLNTTAAQAASTNFNSTSPTSSVFSIGSGTAVNSNTNIYVAYCFSAVAGYSAFGKYTGNGSSDGPFVFTGFRPRFILVKSSSGAFDWHITDTSRSTYNQADTVLFPNSSAAESNGGGYYYDLLSNGFKCRNLGSATNGSGATYIFAAFAESPFKTSLAR